MTELEALNIAYDQLINLMPDGDESDEIFIASEKILKMIKKKEEQKKLATVKRYYKKLENSHKNVNGFPIF